MRVRVHTQSGSVYGFDSNAMTWQRINLNVGHEDILGYDQNKGELNAWPIFPIGEPLIFSAKGLDTYIRTTRIERIELIDY
jgi:hypothetical protein